MSVRNSERRSDLGRWHERRDAGKRLDELGHEWLRRSYVDDKLSISEMARNMGVERHAISTRLQMAGIPIRSLSQTRKLRWDKAFEDRDPLVPVGRSLDDMGYIRLRIDKRHPFSAMGRKSAKTTRLFTVLEHRFVMAQTLGRPLLRNEVVHHINGDRTDNRPENLQLRNTGHGKGHILVCADCGSRHIHAEAI